ncbi:UNVERIFIED_CONTAM: hypothetical protein Sangu_0495900 [Sesamum angustifolium]|uniref:Uncharacterized protein n=1 Tax=Sesamum angustifolium TaxID=2727405 RepID=A0AAW2Q8P5_9LAMI
MYTGTAYHNSYDKGTIIDYAIFQFYAYDKGTSVSEFLDYFGKQSSNYNGGKGLASFISDGSGGLAPDNGFFTACRLKSEGFFTGYLFGLQMIQRD